jgi:hypothetical protein
MAAVGISSDLAIRVGRSGAARIATLDALVPEFLPSLPRDFMDGQTLRYRLNHGGSFLLYSVGDDTHDDGGDASPKNTQRAGPGSVWSGRDWVWPQRSDANQPGA